MPNVPNEKTADLYQLEGKQCPFCKTGAFEADPDFRCIS